MKEYDKAFILGIFIGLFFGLLLFWLIMVPGEYNKPYHNHKKAWTLYVEVKERNLRELQAAQKALDEQYKIDKARIIMEQE